MTFDLNTKLFLSAKKHFLTKAESSCSTYFSLLIKQDICQYYQIMMGVFFRWDCFFYYHQKALIVFLRYLSWTLMNNFSVFLKRLSWKCQMWENLAWINASVFTIYRITRTCHYTYKSSPTVACNHKKITWKKYMQKMSALVFRTLLQVVV